MVLMLRRAQTLAPAFAFLGDFGAFELTELQ